MVDDSRGSGRIIAQKKGGRNKRRGVKKELVAATRVVAQGDNRDSLAQLVGDEIKTGTSHHQLWITRGWRGRFVSFAGNEHTRLCGGGGAGWGTAEVPREGRWASDSAERFAIAKFSRRALSFFFSPSAATRVRTGTVAWRLPVGGGGFVAGWGWGCVRGGTARHEALGAQV